MDETYRDEDDLEFESWVAAMGDLIANEAATYLDAVETSIVATTKATMNQINLFLS